MVDITQLSDEELDAMIQQKKQPDVLSLSDQQLDDEIRRLRSQSKTATRDAERFLQENQPAPPSTEGIAEIPQQPIPINPNVSPVSEVPVDIQGNPVLSTEQSIADLKSAGQTLLNESLPIGGAIGGGIVGGPPGAALGGAGGEAFKQLGQNVGLFGGNPPQTSTEAAAKIGLNAALAGTGEAIGRGLVAAGSKVGSGFSRSVTPEGRETLEFFKNTGIVPNPAKVTDNRILDLASNAGEASIFGGEKFLQGQIQAKDFIDEVIGKMVNTQGMSKELLGELMSEAITKNSNVFRSTGRVLFGRIEESIGQNFVNTAPLRTSAREISNELSALNIEPELVSSLGSIGRTGIGGTGLQQTGLRFSEAQELRSQLLSVIRRSKDVVSDRGMGRIKSLEKSLETEMTRVADASGTSAQWRKANKFWKQGIETFNDRLIKSIMNKDPDAAVSSLFNAGKDKPVMIQRIKRALGDKKLIRDFEDSTLKTLIFRSTDELGEVVPKKLLNNIKSFGGTDGKALKAMFPRGEDKALAKLARIKGVILKGQPDATGRFAVQIGQVTGAAGVVTGQFKKAGMAILIVPDMIARAFRNPKVVRFLTEGAKPRPGLKQATLFVSRLSALLNKERIEHQIFQPDEFPSEPVTLPLASGFQ